MKKKQSPVVATVPVRHVLKTKPDIYADRLSMLSPEQRAQLRALISNPLYVQLLRMVAAFKPSSNVHNGGSGARDAFSDARANARLGEIRGWELYEHAIFLALNDPPQVKQAVMETFPPVDADWNQPGTPSGDTTKKRNSK